MLGRSAKNKTFTRNTKSNMLILLIILSIAAGLVAFLTYPRFPKTIKSATAILLGILVTGSLILFLAPNDYLQRIPEQLTTVLHPYIIALTMLTSVLLLFGVGIGAYYSCLNSRHKRS
jgi:hypothetical protein